MRILLAVLGIIFSTSCFAQDYITSDSHKSDDAPYISGPGLNTVPLFGSTAKANNKHGSTHHKNHNSYSDWIQPGSITIFSPKGASCCNGSNEAGEGKGDCDITRIYRDDNDNEIRYIIYDGYRLNLPNELRVRELDLSFKKSPDGNGHVCVSEFRKGSPKVLCWVDGDGMN